MFVTAVAGKNNTGLIMFRFAVTASVWLSAALVPFQGISASGCGCAVATSQTAGTACAASLGRQSPCGCRCKHRAQAVSASHSCCGRPAPEEHRSCRCGAGCLCQQSDPKPADQVPAQHQRDHRDTTDQIAEVPDFFTTAVEGRQVHCRPAAPLSACAAQGLCISLCRFRL